MLAGHRGVAFQMCGTKELVIQRNGWGLQAGDQVSGASAQLFVQLPNFQATPQQPIKCVRAGGWLAAIAGFGAVIQQLKSTPACRAGDGFNRYATTKTREESNSHTKRYLLTSPSPLPLFPSPLC